MGKIYSQKAFNISIIVPVHNVQLYLKECLDSLVKQSQPNIEIIIVNDGSTDNSLAIINRYALKDERIKVVNQPHSGLGAARNVGLKISSGKYVMFVDADDWISDEACNRLFYVAENSNADVVIFDFTFYDNKYKQYLLRKQYKTSTVISGEEYLLNSMRCRGFSPTVCNKFFKRKIIKNISFPENTKYEDNYFSFMSLLKCKRVVTTNDVSYYYRINRSGSLTSKLTYCDVDDIIGIYRKLIHELKNNGMGYFLENQVVRHNIIERINMEVLIKLIDGTKVLDRNRVIAHVRSNAWFKSLAKDYIQHGRLVRHRIMLAAFYTSPRLFELLGYLYYAVQKIRKKY